MAYMELEVALFTALNKDSQALHHEVVPFDPAEAQALSDKAVDVIRAAEAGELPPRIASAPDFYLCRLCDYARRCWGTGHERDPASDLQARAMRLERTGSATAGPSSRCSGCSAMPDPGRATITRHAIDELGLERQPARAACSTPPSPARPRWS